MKKELEGAVETIEKNKDLIEWLQKELNNTKLGATKAAAPFTGSKFTPSSVGAYSSLGATSTYKPG